MGNSLTYQDEPDDMPMIRSPVNDEPALHANVYVEHNQHEPHRSVKSIAQPVPATKIHF
jgi:hypothetical protein